MKRFVPHLVLALLFASGQMAFAADTVATVNGKKIPSSRFDEMVQSATKQGQPDTPELRKAIKDQLINQELLLEQAEKNGFAKHQDVKDQIENARRQIMIRTFVTDYVKQHAPEKEVQAEVDRMMAERANEKEYLAHHILVETEDEAKAIIEKLNAGGKFEDLAKGTKDPGSAENGGLLDWAPASTYVEPFANALKTLKQGEISAPVKSQFGYHVIRLDDSRPTTVKPDPQELKARATGQLKQAAFEKLMAELKAKAKVQE